MLRRPTKILLAIEVVICFAPLTLLLVMGVVMAPFQFYVAVTRPLDWHAAVTFLVLVTCGAVGFATLAYVLSKLFGGQDSLSRPTLVCIGTALGVSALMQLFLGSPLGWKLVGLLPLAVSTHIFYLARRMLFPSWRDGLRKGAVAAAVALSLLAIPLLDPSRASASTIRDQHALWEQRAPHQYDFTVQLSGDPSGSSKSPEVMMPKRIRVENGRVISASYVWDGGDHHKPGDPARMDNLWTIDRAFTELLAVEERGGDVNVRFNDRWGFVEEARASMNDGSNKSWSVEVRDFSVTSLAAD